MKISSHNAAFIAGAAFILSVCATTTYLNGCDLLNTMPRVDYYFGLAITGLTIAVFFERERRKAKARESIEKIAREAAEKNKAKFERYVKIVQDNERRLYYGRK